MKKAIFVLVLVSAIVFPALCRAQAVGGTWKGKWLSIAGVGTGAITASLVQSGGVVSGKVVLANTSCGTVTVTVSGTVLPSGMAILRGTFKCSAAKSYPFVAHAWTNGAFAAGTYALGPISPNTWADFGSFKMVKQK